MKEQKITIEIDRDGRVKADAEGFTGDLCVKDLERILDGLSVASEFLDRKPDAGSVSAARVNTQKIEKKP